MLTLRGRGYPIYKGDAASAPRIVRLTKDPLRPAPLRKREAFLCEGGELPDGFAWYVILGDANDPCSIAYRSWI